MLGQKLNSFKSLAGKFGIAFVFNDVNYDICSYLEIKRPVLYFFFSFILPYFRFFKLLVSYQNIFFKQKKLFS